MKILVRLLVLVGLSLAGARLPAAERIPPPPAHYFNDYAGVVSAATARRLDAELEQYERDSSNQLLVVVYPKMESDSSVDDYTVRVAQSWRVGQKAKNNGAVLFAFMAEHQLYISVGYGLEPRLTDATCRRIIEGEIVPRFHAGSVESGFTAGVAAMIAASKGEFQGNGRIAGNSAVGQLLGLDPRTLLFIALFGFGVVRFFWGLNRPRVYGRRGGGGWWLGGGGGGWSGGGGSGGGFSGGGGSFGGGGAGGKW